MTIESSARGVTIDAACDHCLARTWLLTRLAGHLDRVRRRIEPVLGLDDAELVDAVAGTTRERVIRELESFDADSAREHARSAQLALVCRHDRRYPARLRLLDTAPAVLHVAGGWERFAALLAEDPVAIVGARNASPYGTEIARALGRGLAAAGVTVISGMALGIDSAAHAGALSGGGGTVAVLPVGSDRPYPASKRALYRQIRQRGALVSELAPGSPAWRWTFPARNRLIAGLAAMTVVIEAGSRSGALVTARFARALGRPLGAVPGRVTSTQAAGPHALIRSGAALIRDPQDVLDELFGAGVRIASNNPREPLTPELSAVLAAIADGRDTAAALASSGASAPTLLAALASLELSGHVRRESGGRFSVVP